AVVFEVETAADAYDGAQFVQAQNPVDDVERVHAPVGYLAAGVIPEPAEVVDSAVEIVAPLRSGAEPQVPIQFRRRVRVRRVAESGRDVADRFRANRHDWADVPLADQIAGPLIMLARALLRAYLHDALVLLRDIDHPTPFTHKECERLFDVHVLAGS